MTACTADAERRRTGVKETHLDLFGTRASCKKFLSNWLRILFSALAYTLMRQLKEMALAGAGLAHATAATLRVGLLKIGAAIVRNTRRIRILLASHHPLRELYFIAASALLHRGQRAGFSVAAIECVPGMLILRGLGEVRPECGNLLKKWATPCFKSNSSPICRQ